jgi:hypothetical protein
MPTPERLARPELKSIPYISLDSRLQHDTLTSTPSDTRPSLPTPHHPPWLRPLLSRLIAPPVGASRSCPPPRRSASRLVHGSPPTRSHRSRQDVEQGACVALSPFSRAALPHSQLRQDCDKASPPLGTGRQDRPTTLLFGAPWHTTISTLLDCIHPPTRTASYRYVCVAHCRLTEAHSLLGGISGVLRHLTNPAYFAISRA